MTVFDKIRDAQVENYTAASIREVTDNLGTFMVEKNRRYGDSALHPVQVFAKDIYPIGQLHVRIDDKLSRIKNSEDFRKNDLVDLMGYLVLLCVALGYTEFNDLID